MACIDGYCVNPCSGFERICLQYGVGYICTVVDRKPQCAISCVSDIECPASMACTDGYCVNPCFGYEEVCLQMGAGYTCQVVKHKPQCFICMYISHFKNHYYV